MSRRFERDTSGQTALIIVGSVVGGLLLLLAVCGGLTFFFVYRFTQQVGPQMQAQAELMEASGAAQMFLNQLSVGQVNNAYNSTTVGFRNRQTLAQFQTFLQRNPLLTQGMAVQDDPADNAPGAQRMTFHYTVTANNAVTKLTIQVALEGDEWKVDAVTSP